MVMPSRGDSDLEVLGPLLLAALGGDPAALDLTDIFGNAVRQPDLGGGSSEGEDSKPSLEGHDIQPIDLGGGLPLEVGLLNFPEFSETTECILVLLEMSVVLEKLNTSAEEFLVKKFNLNPDDLKKLLNESDDEKVKETIENLVKIINNEKKHLFLTDNKGELDTLLKSLKEKINSLSRSLMESKKLLDYSRKIMKNAENAEKVDQLSEDASKQLKLMENCSKDIKENYKDLTTFYNKLPGNSPYTDVMRVVKVASDVIELISGNFGNK